MREDVLTQLQILGYIKDNEALMEDDMLRAMWNALCDMKKIMAIHKSISETINQALDEYYEK